MLDIQQLQYNADEINDDIHQCALLMSSSEPWITLGRRYDESIKILRDPTLERYIATVDKTFAGFVIVQMTGAFVGYIKTVAVTPTMRGRQVGSRLIQFAEERIFAETPNVFMCVSSFNGEAQKLYKRLGYEVVGELKDFIVRGHSEILLRKTIAPLGEFQPE